MSTLLASLTLADAKLIVGAFLTLSAIAYGCNLLARMIWSR